MCVHFDALKTLLVDAKGFDFVEEGLKKKKGFVGLKPGEREGNWPPYHPPSLGLISHRLNCGLDPP